MLSFLKGAAGSYAEREKADRMAKIVADRDAVLQSNRNMEAKVKSDRDIETAALEHKNAISLQATQRGDAIEAARVEQINKGQSDAVKAKALVEKERLDREAKKSEVDKLIGARQSVADTNAGKPPKPPTDVQVAKARGDISKLYEDFPEGSDMPEHAVAQLNALRKVVGEGKLKQIITEVTGKEGGWFGIGSTEDSEEFSLVPDAEEAPSIIGKGKKALTKEIFNEFKKKGGSKEETKRLLIQAGYEI